MSYHTWTIYGYGICTTDIADIMYFSKDEDYKKVEGLMKCLELAPNFKSEFIKWSVESECDCYSAYMDYEDECGYLNIGAILKPIIKEKFNIDLTICDDFDGKQYLLYQPIYPWFNYTDEELTMTPEKLDEIFCIFTNFLYGKMIKGDYQEVENGC